ncbi:receptor activity-modifying protein 3 isoform X1 [Kogia breviceps]|uniref:receptor activity-modifying protein 3 isoform X1 n=1 Tax=Kogia breviceps TaxID=27615 RepID=UPI0034D2C6D2
MVHRSWTARRSWSAMGTREWWRPHLLPLLLLLLCGECPPVGGCNEKRMLSLLPHCGEAFAERMKKVEVWKWCNLSEFIVSARCPPPEGVGAGTLDVSLTEVCSVCSMWTSAQWSGCCRRPPGFNPSLTTYDVTFDTYVASAQMREEKLREAKGVAQGHTARKRHSQGLCSGRLDPPTMFLGFKFFHLVNSSRPVSGRL